MTVQMVPLRSVADVRVSNIDKKSVTSEKAVRLCNYTDVYYNRLVTDRLSFMTATATQQQIGRFELMAGDSIITKDSETVDDIGVPTFVPKDLPGVVCGYHLALIRPQQMINPRFLSWALHSEFVSAQLAVRASGVTRFGLTYGAIKGLQIPLPDLEKQRRIADFLDDQVTRIDQAIQLRERQIDSLLSRYLAEWDEGARKLSAQFGIVRLRRVLRSITDGPFGSSLTSAHYTESGTRVIRLGNIGRGEFLPEDEAYIAEEYGRTLRQHSVAAGDLIIAGLGDERRPLGRCAIVPDNLGPAIVKADCYRVRLNESISMPFAAWFLSSPLAESHIRLLSRGATRARLNTDVVRDAPVTLPSWSIQEGTVRCWARSRDVHASTTSSLRRSIELLEERKRALITAAVTGEFDVASASVRASEVATRS